MKFVMETIATTGTRKVYVLPGDSPANWTKRQIVADFVKGRDGDIAFALFCKGLSLTIGASLYDKDAGHYKVGTVSQLMGEA